MRSVHRSAVFGVVLGLLAFTACGGSGSPATSPAYQAQAVGFDGGSGILNFAGEYSGTIDDAKFGKGSVKASFAQFQGAAGGSFDQTYAKVKVDSSLALLEKGDAVHGTSVATIVATACSFAFSGTYDVKTFALTGSFKAVHGCTGQGGTYALKEQCSYPPAFAIRQQTGPKPC
jgi:hypothetical protein